MLDLAKSLKNSGYVVGVLSNAEIAFRNHFFDNGYGEIFNPAIFSCDVGCLKPDHKIYQGLLNKLGLSGEEVIFIDDRLENIETLNLVGINGIHYTDYKLLLIKLKDYKVKIY